jgi:hypothetical protein
MAEGDAEGGEFEFEGDTASASWDAGEHRPVVRQHLGWEPVTGGGLAEAVDDVGGLERVADVGANDEAGVVVELVEDLDVGAVGEGPVGGVDLPAFIGLVGLEAHEGALGPLVGLGGDEAPPDQHPPNGRHRGGSAVAALEVRSDRLGAAVVAGLVEFLSQRHDLVLHRCGDAMWAVLRSP